MQKGRLEAFSDGVFAIIITIMVLEFKRPEGVTLAALQPLVPVAIAYVVSFVMVGIYWNNHHHMMQAADQINGRVLWANLHLLFWLSLVPFFTGWIGGSDFAVAPVAGLGVTLFFAGFAYYLMTHALLGANHQDSKLARALRTTYKEWLSLALYASAILIALVWSPRLAFGIYVLVAVLWFVPDRRMEREFKRDPAKLI
jgi:uncharacterized membrane protein